MIYEPILSFYEQFFSPKCLAKIFLQNCKNMKIQIFTFSLITFDSFEVHECAIPKNNRLSQNDLSLVQRILEHLEWKLLGDCSKSKTIGDSKEAL